MLANPSIIVQMKFYGREVKMDSCLLSAGITAGRYDEKSGAISEEASRCGL